MFALCLGEPFPLVEAEVAQQLSLAWRLLQDRKLERSPVLSLCSCRTDGPFSCQCSGGCWMSVRQTLHLISPRLLGLHVNHSKYSYGQIPHQQLDVFLIWDNNRLMRLTPLL